jgi:S-disulfanyl-L-cysteine oxidoreductase SoxD
LVLTSGSRALARLVLAAAAACAASGEDVGAQASAAGGAAAETAIATETATAADTASTRDGIFTTEQARRGQAAYTGPCDRCHGYKLDGASDDPDMLPAPPVAGPKFLRNWNGRTLAALVEYLRVTMPANNPGYLSDGEWADIVAYMLSVSGMPAGAEALQPDAETLARIVIAPRPE